MISEDIIKWLIEPENPSVKYRTMVELLDKSQDDIEVQKCKNQIAISNPVKILLSKMHPDGYWLQKHSRTGEMLGDGVEYGAFGTTHYCLSYLAELGIDRSNPQVAKAAERYLSLQKSNGNFYRHFSCLIGYNIRTFVMLGYKDDARIKKSIDLLLNTERPDGGYLCDMHEGKYKIKPVKSCIRGSVKVLLAFSHLPEYWQHNRIKKLVDYFLSRGAIFKRTNMDELVNRDMERNSFPITWRANVFEILLVLSKMGYGKDSRLEKAWSVLDAKRDSKGRYFLDWTPRQSPWKVGKRNEPNKWITFYAYLAHKFKDNTRAGDNLREMEIRLERLKRMRAAYTHAFSDTPEEDTRKRMIEWLKSKGLNEKSVKARIFGRNTYSTDKPEPHGYELYLTVHCDNETEGDIKAREIPEGLYAVLRFKNLNKIGEAWKKLWKWIKQSEYEHVGWKKGEHGWVDGFEEHLNWQEGKPQTEWIFDLWVQLKE